MKVLPLPKCQDNHGEEEFVLELSPAPARAQLGEAVEATEGAGPDQPEEVAVPKLKKEVIISCLQCYFFRCESISITEFFPLSPSPAILFILMSSITDYVQSHVVFGLHT